MSHSIRELKPAMLSSAKARDKESLVAAFAIARSYYSSPGARLVDADAGDWLEVNNAIEAEFGPLGLEEIKKAAGKRVTPKDTRLVEEAVARAMEDGRLPS